MGGGGGSTVISSKSGGVSNKEVMCTMKRGTKVYFCLVFDKKLVRYALFVKILTYMEEKVHGTHQIVLKMWGTNGLMGWGTLLMGGRPIYQTTDRLYL